MARKKNKNEPHKNNKKNPDEVYLTHGTQLSIANELSFTLWFFFLCLIIFSVLRPMGANG